MNLDLSNSEHPDSSQHRNEHETLPLQGNETIPQQLRSQGRYEKVQRRDKNDINTNQILEIYRNTNAPIVEVQRTQPTKMIKKDVPKVPQNDPQKVAYINKYGDYKFLTLQNYKELDLLMDKYKAYREAKPSTKSTKQKNDQLQFYRIMCISIFQLRHLGSTEPNNLTIMEKKLTNNRLIIHEWVLDHIFPSFQDVLQKAKLDDKDLSDKYNLMVINLKDTTNQKLRRGIIQKRLQGRILFEKNEFFFSEYKKALLAREQRNLLAQAEIDLFQRNDKEQQQEHYSESQEHNFNQFKKLDSNNYLEQKPKDNTPKLEQFKILFNDILQRMQNNIEESLKNTNSYHEIMQDFNQKLKQ